MNLSPSQKSSWSKIKTDILKRPLLLFRIGLNHSESSNILSDNYPEKSTFEYIKEELIKIRVENINRLKPALNDFVNHRGSNKIAKKIGTDGMTIKYIIDGKLNKRLPSHDLISKIEIYLSYKVNYDISLENKQDELKYLPNKIDELKLLNQAAIQHILETKMGFDKLKMLKKHDIKENVKILDLWEISSLKYHLRNAIETLEQIETDTHQLIEIHI